jgi:hypothetical protein
LRANRLDCIVLSVRQSETALIYLDPLSDAILGGNTKNGIQTQFLTAEFDPETAAHLDLSLADDLHLDDPPDRALAFFPQN